MLKKITIGGIVAIIGVVATTLVVYCNGLPTKTQVEKNTKDIEGNRSKINDIRDQTTRILSGLCIIDPRTCSLKKRPE